MATWRSALLACDYLNDKNKAKLRKKRNKQRNNNNKKSGAYSAGTTLYHLYALTHLVLFVGCVSPRPLTGKGKLSLLSWSSRFGCQVIVFVTDKRWTMPVKTLLLMSCVSLMLLILLLTAHFLSLCPTSYDRWRPWRRWRRSRNDSRWRRMSTRTRRFTQAPMRPIVFVNRLFNIATTDTLPHLIQSLFQVYTRLYYYTRNLDHSRRDGRDTTLQSLPCVSDCCHMNKKVHTGSSALMSCLCHPLILT
jgi:hypothetical protein